MWVLANDGNYVNLNAATRITIGDQGDGTFAVYASGERLATLSSFTSFQEAESAIAALLGDALVSI